MRHSIFFLSYYVFEIWCEFNIYIAPHLGAVIFQGLYGHLCLVVTILGLTGTRELWRKVLKKSINTYMFCIWTYLFCVMGALRFYSWKGLEGPSDFSTIQISLQKWSQPPSSSQNCWLLVAHSRVFLWDLPQAKQVTLLREGSTSNKELLPWDKTGCLASTGGCPARPPGSRASLEQQPKPLLQLHLSRDSPSVWPATFAFFQVLFLTAPCPIHTPPTSWSSSQSLFPGSPLKPYTPSPSLILSSLIFAQGHRGLWASARRLTASLQQRRKCRITANSLNRPSMSEIILASPSAIGDWWEACHSVYKCGKIGCHWTVQGAPHFGPALSQGGPWDLYLELEGPSSLSQRNTGSGAGRGFLPSKRGLEAK